MLRTSVLTLAMAASLIAMVPQAFAMPAPPPPPPCANCGGGGGNGGGGGGGGNGPTSDLPPPSVEEQIAAMENACNAALSHLVRIPVKMVEEFDNAGAVAIVPVCNSGLGHKATLDGSQAMPLLPAIAANTVLIGSLGARGFGADDVVGLVLVDGVVTLYVHKSA